MNIDPFFRYARRRYQIKINRDLRLEKPWTTDQILQRYRFCNVFREDDKVTTWFRENWRDENATVFGCVAFRFFNRISTGEILVQNGLLDNWNPRLAIKLLRNVSPFIGPAYRIPTRPDWPKLDGILDVLRPVWSAQRRGDFDEFPHLSMREAHECLTQFPYLGPFMAYEAVSDMQHTPILCGAKDINTWTSSGPGSARGLARLLKTPLADVNYGSRTSQERMLENISFLVEKSHLDCYWPDEWPRWDARTAEHTLCEFDKYERVRLGEGHPKLTYPGREEVNHDAQ